MTYRPTDTGLRWLIALGLSAGAIAVLEPTCFGTEPSATLQALPGGEDLDSDGDMVPDHIEWVVLTDPNNPDTDGDGVDDFLAMVQHRMPSAATGGPMMRPLDHEMRATSSIVRNAAGQDEVWMHFMFRFVGGRVPPIQAFAPFLDLGGVRFPIGSLLGQTSMSIAVQQHASQGMYLRLSLHLASPELLTRVTPCTVGVEASLDGRQVISGVYLVNPSNSLSALVPVAPGSVVVQSLSAQETANPFWTAGRVCTFRLSILGRLSTGVLCEVSEADCTVNGQLRCPTNCESSEGSVLVFPEGIGGITGIPR